MRTASSIPPLGVKQSTVYSCWFPPQDHKFKTGDDCLISDTLVRAGKIVKLDEDQLLVQINRGNQSGRLPEELSITPTGPIDSRVLRDALYRFGDSRIAGDGKYPALERLLLRQSPRVRGLAEGEPLIRGDTRLVDEVPRVDLRTVTCSSRALRVPERLCCIGCDLAPDSERKAGGCLFQLPQAINNLLSAVEEKAREGVSFSGLKKSTRGQLETFFEGDFIRDVTSSSDISLEAQLIAGTAWLFALEEFDKALDYLFVDDAGQVSLANAVALGMSADNLVLIGDPIQ